jgi:hypothetical protein
MFEHFISLHYRAVNVPQRLLRVFATRLIFLVVLNSLYGKSEREVIYGFVFAFARNETSQQNRNHVLFQLYHQDAMERVQHYHGGPCQQRNGWRWWWWIAFALVVVCGTHHQES